MGIFFFYSFGDHLDIMKNTIYNSFRRKWLSLCFRDCNINGQTAVKPDYKKH